MNNIECKKLNTQITRRITELQSHLNAGAVADNRSGIQGDDADDALASSVGRQITASEKQELARLRTNLKWLDSEEAGYCATCGKEIPFERLRAVPVTRLCIDCAK